MTVLSRALDPNNLRSLFDALSFSTDLARGVRDDRGFLTVVRRALIHLPTDKPLPALDPLRFEAFPVLSVPHLESRRFAVVISGGSGATASTVGVQRALEDAGLEPVALSAASGGVLFGALWAAGWSAQQVADFWLGLRQEEYVDPDWRALFRAGSHRLEGWAGLIRGRALEESVRARLGRMTLGETRIPFSMVAWNVDLNRVEYFGTEQTPSLEIATAIRLAISIPIFVEPVEVRGHVYGDGGIVDIFPVRPVLAHEPDHVLGLNCYLPRDFTGEDVTGWHARPFAILRASGQLRWSGMVALAREEARLAGDKLVLLHPVPYSEVRGARFYETFLDRRRWPLFMLAGRRETREALLTLELAAARAGGEDEHPAPG